MKTLKRKMKKTLPRLSRTQVREQYPRHQIKNPRSRFLIQIVKIIHFLLLQIQKRDARSPNWKAIWGKSPQNLKTLRLYEGYDEQQRTKAAVLKEKFNDGKPISLQRRRQNKRRGLSLEEPRSLWRLGLMSCTHYSSLIHQIIVGAKKKLQAVGKLQENKLSSHGKENWEEISSSPWTSLERRWILTLNRLYQLSPSLDKVIKLLDLVYVCWCTGFKVKIICFDEESAKKQSENMNLIGQSEPISTMVDKTLKGSAHAKSFETGPSGSKTEKGNNKACWCTGFKVKILCFDEESVKEQSENMNLIGQSKPISTMVDKTLKGSAHAKSFETGPSGSKTEKGNNKAKIDTIMLALSHWISWLMYDWNTASTMLDKKLSMIDYLATFDRASSLPRCTSVDNFSYCYQSTCLLLIVRRIFVKMWTCVIYFEYFSGQTLGDLKIFAFIIVGKPKIIIEFCRLSWFLLLAKYGTLSMGQLYMVLDAAGTVTATKLHDINTPSWYLEFVRITYTDSFMHVSFIQWKPHCMKFNDRKTLHCCRDIYNFSWVICLNAMQDKFKTDTRTWQLGRSTFRELHTKTSWKLDGSTAP